MITTTVDPQPADEQSIVWLTDPAGLPYVRETLYQSARSRGGPVQMPGARVIGYAELKPAARSGPGRYFTRRVFWLNPGSDPYPGPCVPSEAVLPASVCAGVPSAPITASGTGIQDEPSRTTAKPPTRRQIVTAAQYAFGDSRARVTQAEIAAKFGITPSAVSKRLKRFKEALPDDALSRYMRATRRGRKRRVIAFQLNEMDNV